MEKRKKEDKQKGLNVKLAFVFDQGHLVKIEEVRLALLKKGKRLSQSALMRMAVDTLHEKVLGKK